MRGSSYNGGCQTPKKEIFWWVEGGIGWAFPEKFVIS
jgi:hypothetical protein